MRCQENNLELNISTTMDPIDYRKYQAGGHTPININDVTVESAASGSWEFKSLRALVSYHHDHQNSKMKSSIDWRHSRWTPGYSAISTVAPSRTMSDCISTQHVESFSSMSPEWSCHSEKRLLKSLPQIFYILYMFIHVYRIICVWCSLHKFYFTHYCGGPGEIKVFLESRTSPKIDHVFLKCKSSLS